MQLRTYTYDVIIVGGGVAGCATAIALKNCQPELSVAILERKEDMSNTNRPCYSIGETLPPQTSAQLRSLGIWESFLKQDFIRSYGTSAAWGGSKLYCNEFMYSPFGYGWRLDRSVFDQFMIQEAQQKEVNFHFNSHMSSVIRIDEMWIVNTTQKQFKARFVVDATGRKTAIASKLGIEKISTDQLVGIYRFYEGQERPSDFQEGTYIESDENGWWYSTTLPNNKTVVAYMTDADIANTHGLRKPDQFDRILKQSRFTWKRVSEKDTRNTPQVVAAHTQYLNNATGDGWLSVGDATMSYDPLSSLGIFKSLITSQLASFAIKDCLHGNPQALPRYQQIMESEFKGYQKKWKEHYAQEERFSNHSFWQRRQNVII